MTKSDSFKNNYWSIEPCSFKLEIKFIRNLIKTAQQTYWSKKYNSHSMKLEINY